MFDDTTTVIVYVSSRGRNPHGRDSLQFALPIASPA